MNLNQYRLEDCLLTAMKSEIDSRVFYMKLAKKVKNYLLKDKLNFLADEEEKHKLFIEEIWKNHFPDEKIIMPEQCVIPLPEVTITDEDIPLSKLLLQAMEAEKTAQDFYNSLSQRFIENSKIYNTLIYFADMENQHYKILEMEKDSMERFEEADVYWPMVHVGP